MREQARYANPSQLLATTFPVVSYHVRAPLAMTGHRACHHVTLSLATSFQSAYSKSFFLTRHRFPFWGSPSLRRTGRVEGPAGVGEIASPSGEALH